MFKRSPIYAIMMFLLGIVPVIAQGVSCPTLVEQALNAVGDNCSDMGRNSACYGYNQVDATFSGEFPENYFSVPTDRASLTDLDTLRTLPMDTNSSRWGVAVMNIQANLPNTLPGQGVIVMLIGDAEVRNDVAPEEASMIVDPISSVMLEEGFLYKSPSTSGEIIRVVPVNEILLIDGVNPTQAFLRVVSEDEIGWVEREHVARLMAMDALPTIGGSFPTPMQAFYLSTGIGESECSEADPMIAVQSPENITVDLTVNGVDIRVGSLVTFRNIARNTINMTVHRGGVTTVFGNTINAGESAIGIVNNDPNQEGSIIAWSDALPASEEEMLLGQRAQNGINSLARNNGWTERQIETTPPPESPGGEVIHIVSRGETLYSIGRLYDTSLPEVVARNGLSAPYRLFPGQELVIPNPGNGFVGLPGNPAPVVPPPPIPEGEIIVDFCATLRLTSPLNTVPTEPVPYYWDGVAGATQYQVNIFDQATGQLMGTFYTNGNETSIVISAGELMVGGAMQWQVIALLNGQVLCATGLSQPILHAAPVDTSDGSPQGNFKLDWRCSGYQQLEIIWQDAPKGDTIEFEVRDDARQIYNYDKRRENGSFVHDTFGFFVRKVKAKTSSGLEDSISGNKDCP